MYKILDFNSDKAKCSHQGCTKKLNQEDLTQHEINCKYRVISCPLAAFKKCSEEMRIKDVKKHLITNHADNDISMSTRNSIAIFWIKAGSKFYKPRKSDESSLCIFKTLDGQNVFVYIDNGRKSDRIFKIHAFLIDAPKKASNLSFQAKAKKSEVATVYLKRSGPMNAIDELNPQPCFHMTLEESQKYGGTANGPERTVLDFKVLDQTPKTSVLDLAFKNCKKVLQKLK